MRALLIRAVVIASVIACAVACGDDVQPPARTIAPSPTQGVDSAGLAALLTEHWALEAAADPFTATYLGEHSVDAQLPPVSADDVAALRRRRRDLLARIAAFNASALSPRDHLTYGVLLERLTAEAGLDVCDYERWQISSQDNLVRRLDLLGRTHPLLGPEDAASYLARVQAMPAAVDAFGSQLVAGAAAGETAARPSVLSVIGQLSAWSERAPADWPLVQAIDDGYLGSGDRDRLRAAVTAVVTDQLGPAYRRLAITLNSAIVPVALPVEGLSRLALGHDCYAAEIRHHTTLPMTAAELHELGLSEVARVEAAIVALGHEVYGVDTLPEILARLDADPAQRFRSEPEIVDWAEATIARARTVVTPLFATFPAEPLEVTPYPASYGQIAASYGQSPDGVQPARFYLVTQPPGAQFRWNMEAVTFHETIPGHHLQVGRMAELASLPALRRVFNDTAYVEGWGLYAETLADELGMYSDAPARLGRLSNEALRACRLVIDTGLHDLGWTRDQAAAFLAQHSLYSGEFVDTEIERYLAGPGQALAYKVGELHLLSLRAEVQARDGAAFSLRTFHEAVLEAGSLPLTLLAEKLLGPPGVLLRPRAR